MSFKRSETIRYRVINEESCNNFQQNVSNINFHEVFSTNHVNDAYASFITPISKCYEEAFPLVTKTLKSSSKNNKPWLSNGILISCKNKNKLYIDYIKTPTYKHKIEYQSYKKSLKKIIRKAEKMHYEEKFLAIKDKMKETWGLINNILKRKKETQKPNINFQIGNRSVSNPLEIAESFNTSGRKCKSSEYLDKSTRPANNLF